MYFICFIRSSARKFLIGVGIGICIGIEKVNPKLKYSQQSSILFEPFMHATGLPQQPVTHKGIQAKHGAVGR